MMTYQRLHPLATSDHLGYLPDFLSEGDPRPAREQFNANYAHGGGWRPFQGHVLLENGNLQYPEDPPMRALFRTQLRDETITFFECAWVMVTQPDGSYEIARMD